MKILTLIENTAIHSALASEHGLSLYIEANGRKILFDAGQSNAFADNAAALGVDLSKVDLAVLSHGHYDHSGGLMHFLQINDHAPVYLSRHAFSECYHGNERYIGIDPSLQNSDRLIYTDDVCPICNGLTLYSCNQRPLIHPIDSAGLTVLENGTYRDDTFAHEQYLLIEEDGKTVLISGCSHKGILNIAGWFQPDHLFGGFHFMNLDPAENSAFLNAACKELLQYKTMYYTGHCTGSAQFDHMKVLMGSRLQAMQGGSLHII